MTKGFWDNLPRPFFVLAPMADVTDATFRRVVAKYGKPDVMYTEFVSADGLFKGGYDHLIHDLDFSEAERPIVAQFFSKDPELMKKAATLAVEKGFDGVDINMGCPDKNVCKQGAGAAMIQTPDLAREIIRATKGASGGLPVSVKTRIGFNTIETDSWVRELLTEEPAALILHARTKKEMSKVSAHWDEITKAVKIRDEMGSKTLIVGNGDVMNLDEARERVEDTGADGIMLGRAMFGRPELFAYLAKYASSEERLEAETLNTPRPPLEERLKVLKEHIALYNELLGEVKPFHIMKKHFKAYIRGEDGNKVLLQKLMDTQSAEEAIDILDTENP